MDTKLLLFLDDVKHYKCLFYSNEIDRDYFIKKVKELQEGYKEKK